jgi:hypothetical protein
MKRLRIAALSLLAATTAFAGPGLFEDDCRYTQARRAAAPAAGISKIVIHADSGFLKVDGTTGTGQVIASGTACTSEEDFINRMTLTTRRHGSELHIIAEIPEKTVIFGFFQARLDFTVTMPQYIPVDIRDDSGWIKTANTGHLNIDDDSGAIEVRNVRGHLHIEDDSGEIDIEGVTGNVEIEDDSGEITVRNVNGSVDIEDDSGAINVERVASLHISNDDSGAIVAQNIRGNVRIDSDSSGAVAVSDVAGDFVVGRKGSGSIDYARVSGRIDIPERHRKGR